MIYEGLIDEWKKVGKKIVRLLFFYLLWVDEFSCEVSRGSGFVRFLINIDIIFEGEVVLLLEI